MEGKSSEDKSRLIKSLEEKTMEGKIWEVKSMLPKAKELIDGSFEEFERVAGAIYVFKIYEGKIKGIGGDVKRRVLEEIKSDPLLIGKEGENVAKILLDIIMNSKRKGKSRGESEFSLIKLKEEYRNRARDLKKKIELKNNKKELKELGNKIIG